MDDLGGARDLRRLKAIGVGAPVVFLVAFEAFRGLVIDAAFPTPESNLVAGLLGVAAALAFGLVLFFHIERAQRHIVARNRDLAIVSGVSTAIQGEVEVDAVVDAALDVIVRATGAVEAQVTIQPLDPDAGPPREIVRTSVDATADALAAPDHPIDIALATGASPIGRLHLRVPASRVRDLPSAEALHTVGHQLAAALEIGRLVADLGRRRDEGHVLYQCLLQISNQVPLPDILAGIVAGARERLAADEGRVCLTTSVLAAFEDDEALSRRLTEGIACELPNEAAAAGDRQGSPRAAGGHRCGAEGFEAGLRVPVWVPGELLGELSLARHGGPPFTERDRRYLVTLAGITAIAIAAARLRANERQGAILAERDRIARELHDSLAQVLGSTHLRLRMLLSRPELIDRPRVATELDELADVCEEAYRDVREAILGLREASRGRGLLTALAAYVEKFSQQSGVPVDLEATVGDEPGLSSSSEIQVIRVIQEALTNVRKHARATRAHVRVADAPGGDGLMIVVEDDGRGFDPADVRAHRDGGYGLATMRERMELAGGSLTIDSSPGRGTRVIAIVPQNPRIRTAIAAGQ
ncbi:MAG TPA: sensor histidine kinase [Candidatus Limnocylindrales bacterium]|nr:sensor histidine kinase [Candidatus Limnocylindrales bacterium]